MRLKREELWLQSNDGKIVTPFGSIDSSGAIVVGNSSIPQKINGESLLIGETDHEYDINGGTIDGTVIGGDDPAAITGTTITGATVDATTDFTVGATVITDGVITDATGLLISAAIDINSGTIDGATIGAASPSSIVGTTIDANTDFTVGSTVITDGVITDTTGLLITAALTSTSGGSLTGTWSNLGIVTTIDINGGTIDGAIIGGATPAAITGTTISGSTSVNGITDLTSTPTRTMILTAAGATPTTTIGAADPAVIEAGTNDIDYYVVDFDTSSEERCFWNIAMPGSYNGGTVTATFYWTNAGGGSGETVVWGIKALALNNDEAIDQAYGTEITTSDTWIAQNDVHISPTSSAITIGGSPAGDEYVVFNVGRKVASDDLSGDARLIAVRVEYTANAYSD